MINIFYPILTIALLIAGVICDSPWCIAFAIVLLAGAVASVLIARSVIKSAVFSIGAPAVVSKNKDFKVNIKTEKKNIFPFGKVVMFLKIENRLTGESRKYILKDLKETIVLKSRYCGCLDIAVDKIFVYDWFGIWKFKKKSDCKDRVLVMPDVFSLEPGTLASYGVVSDTEEYSPDKKGNDRSETFQVREYVKGDPLPMIHWKLSSKAGTLMVRDASLPVDHSLVVLFEKKGIDKDPACADALVESVVSFMSAYATNGIPFTVVWNEEMINEVKVATEDQVYEVITSILKARIPRNETSGTAMYVRSGNVQEGSNVFLFAAEIPQELPELADFSNLKAFICDKEAAYRSDSIYYFTPEDKEQVIAEAIIGD